MFRPSSIDSVYRTRPKGTVLWLFASCNVDRWTTQVYWEAQAYGAVGLEASVAPLGVDKKAKGLIIFRTWVTR